jgi:hypothetical protein
MNTHAWKVVGVLDIIIAVTSSGFNSIKGSDQARLGQQN